MKRRAVRLKAARRINLLKLCASKLSSLLFQALPSYPLAVVRQAILGIELPIALLARETPAQSQSLRLAMAGNKLPGPGSEILLCAK